MLARWTFLLVTIYFLLGSVLSVYGCNKYLHKVTGDKVAVTRSDAEHGTCPAPVNGANGIIQQSGVHAAGFWEITKTRSRHIAEFHSMTRWPYPFLDLSSTYAPIWYFVVAVMHIPCYAAFPLIIKMKHFLLSRWFPLSYSPKK
ncbi:hypothetical protein GW17_00014249 [Ensete ventricosum]|nr:hypothetical protein GW17_00014249 [Ensete ventricosum]